MVQKRSKKEKAKLLKNMREYNLRNAGKMEDWKVDVSSLPRSMKNAMMAKGAIRRKKGKK
tara:strand:+ start:92 stop:271 length:180 start_codon:yes stop_codon:yes gene_type:complete